MDHISQNQICEEELGRYLAHHGVLNQKWGVRHGPPYPLDSSVSTGKKLKYDSDGFKGNKKEQGSAAAIAIMIAAPFAVTATRIAIAAASMKAQEKKLQSTRQKEFEKEVANMSPEAKKWLEAMSSKKKGTEVNTEGVKKKTQTMTPEADAKKANPKFPSKGYTGNCPHCVAAMELRRRGYDVEACKGTPRFPHELAQFMGVDIGKVHNPPKVSDKFYKDTFLFNNARKSDKAWNDFTDHMNDISLSQRVDEFTKRMEKKFPQQNARGAIGGDWIGTRSGHVMFFEKNSKNEFVIYDPQSGYTMPLTDFCKTIDPRTIQTFRTDQTTIDVGDLVKKGVVKNA